MGNNAFRLFSPFRLVSEEGTDYLRCTFRMKKKSDREKKMFNVKLKFKTHLPLTAVKVKLYLLSEK